jgi:5-hydroxyisourate hydrolase-like protein (transthyretin family)
LLRETVTNAAGRTDEPLIAGGPLRIGTYELQADGGGYFQAGFYDVIPVRFAISEPEADYHVPLLISPFGYSAYRGS